VPQGFFASSAVRLQVSIVPPPFDTSLHEYLIDTLAVCSCRACNSETRQSMNTVHSQGSRPIRRRASLMAIAHNPAGPPSASFRIDDMQRCEFDDDAATCAPRL